MFLITLQISESKNHSRNIKKNILEDDESENLGTSDSRNPCGEY